jgi:membrane protein implicated in regulation of membrane protease activity
VCPDIPDGTGNISPAPHFPVLSEYHFFHVHLLTAADALYPAFSFLLYFIASLIAVSGCGGTALLLPSPSQMQFLIAGMPLILYAEYILAKSIQQENNKKQVKINKP